MLAMHVHTHTHTHTTHTHTHTHGLIFSDGIEKTLPYLQVQLHLIAHKRAFVQVFKLRHPDAPAGSETFESYGEGLLARIGKTSLSLSVCLSVSVFLLSVCLSVCLSVVWCFRPVLPAFMIAHTAALVALLQLLHGPLSAHTRSERDKDLIELVLTIFRNVLSAPDPDVRG
jgi:hypothetical protein